MIYSYKQIWKLERRDQFVSAEFDFLQKHILIFDSKGAVNPYLDQSVSSGHSLSVSHPGEQALYFGPI